MRKITKLLLCLSSVLILSCEQKETSSIEGLWLVEKVTAGKNSMTPLGRWVKFNSDSTQVSGNGWLQHSEGTWSLKQQELAIVNTNGIKDEFLPFKITYSDNAMQWVREEEGEEVVVSLKRINELPKTSGNQILGLWKLTSATEEGKDISATLNPDNKATFFFRWDQMYVAHHMPSGTKSGVYKIHGHQPEIQLVNYGNPSRFTFWSYKVTDTTLEMVSTDKKSTLKFKRIYQFIQ